MALALDGSATGSSTGTTSFPSGTLTTTNTNDVIVAVVYTENDPNAALITVSSVTATGLTFVKRGGISNANSPIAGFYVDLEVWWAAASSTFSGAITAHVSGVPDDAEINVFGVSGANTSSPFSDGNVSLPATKANDTPAGNPTLTGISTSNANDFIFCAVGVDQSGTAQTVGSIGGTAATLIGTVTGGGGCVLASEYRVVAATQSSISASFGTSTLLGTEILMYADAIVAASGAPVIVPPPKRRIIPVRSLRWI